MAEQNILLTMYRAFCAVFLFMYLKKLYRQSKFWFVIVVLFAASQLFIDYKNGVEVSPFYHYSMFSLPYHFAGAYDCVDVSINGKPLQTKDFTPNGWDNIVMPVIQYQHQKEWNRTMYHQTISRLLPVSDSTVYTNELPQKEFDDWYHRRIIRLLNIADFNTVVHYAVMSYRLQNHELVK